MNLKRLLLILLSIITYVAAYPDGFVYSKYTVLDGLNDNHVQHILQLSDGRMAFTTLGNINLYDGYRFQTIHFNGKDIDRYTLSNYKGAYRVYESKDHLLWVKNFKQVWCADLKTNQYVSHLEAYFRNEGVRGSVIDLFVDSSLQIWLLTSRGLWNGQFGQMLKISAHWGQLQDVEFHKGKVFLFFSTGLVAAYDAKSGRLQYTSDAFGPQERSLYTETSMITKGSDGRIYQLRGNGWTHTVCLVFDPTTRRWQQLLKVPYLLHTMFVTQEGKIYISCAKGLWVIDQQQHSYVLKEHLKIDDGTTETAVSNTIYQDSEGGIWIGTYNHGLLYTHTLRNRMRSAPHLSDLGVTYAFPEKSDIKYYQASRVTDTLVDSRGWKWISTTDGVHLEIPDKPVKRFYMEEGLASDFVHGITEDFNHHIWLSTSRGITQIRIPEFIFSSYSWADGALKGEYSDGKTATLPDGSIIMGGLNGWTLFHPDSLLTPAIPLRPALVGLSVNGESEERVTFLREKEFDYQHNSLSFVFSAQNYAQPERTIYRYRLLNASDTTWKVVTPHSAQGILSNNGILSLSFVHLSPGDYTLQVMASLDADAWQGEMREFHFVIHHPWWSTTWAYLLYVVLICGFIVGCFALYRHQIKMRHNEEILLLKIKNLIEQVGQYERQTDMTEPELKEEPKLSPSDNEFLTRAIKLVEENIDQPYTVEQLSHDLCMERTGLYKKLTLLMDTSPVIFIRNIRLRKAAEMLLQGEKSISEIAVATGFGSSSYFSKCFQKAYGCKPSEYTNKTNEEIS